MTAVYTGTYQSTGIAWHPSEQRNVPSVVAAAAAAVVVVVVVG